MTADLQDASSEVSRDLSGEWLELSSRVRRLAIEAQANGANPEFAGEAQRLCDHVERLHADVEQLLTSYRSMEAAALHDGPLETLPTPPPQEIEKANLEIQREMHSKSDLQHIIKALFMWKDDPIERVRGKGE
jgi:hypothetical protein